MSDFWGFTDSSELEDLAGDTPDAILKEQVDILAEKTDSQIYGKLTNCRVSDRAYDIEYKLASIFDIVVPTLDNYSTTILIMYSCPENEYPIAITAGSSYVNDMDNFMPEYKCKTKEEFEDALKSILSSEEIIRKIKVLYSKSMNF